MSLVYKIDPLYLTGGRPLLLYRQVVPHDLVVLPGRQLRGRVDDVLQGSRGDDHLAGRVGISGRDLGLVLYFLGRATHLFKF